MISLVIGIWIIKIMSDELPYVDQWTRRYVASFENTGTFDFLRVMTEFGSASFLIPFAVIITLLLLFFQRDWLPALFFGGGILVTHLFNELIKQLIQRERPTIWQEVNAEGFSFPSGHAMISIVCYGLCAHYLRQNVKSARLKSAITLFFTLIILLIGFSRYVINVHFLTDVLTGFMLGGVCLWGLLVLERKVRIKRSQP